MSLVVVGLNHHTAPVGLLERMTVPSSGLPKALHDLIGREHLAEAVLLATCNRIEVYARTTRFHDGVDDVRHFLADTSGVAPEALSEELYTYHDEAAVAHLFGVASGLDSMIIGEGEILGQVRDAWINAEREQSAGVLLSRVFRQAVEVGKRARTETAIGRHAVSVSSAAVQVAADRLGSLEGRRVLLMGAGDVGEGMAIALSGAGVDEIVVANRSRARGSELANRVGGRVVPLDDVLDALVSCDVLLASSGAPGTLIERADMEEVMRRRDGRALLVVDVAVPRDVDPGVGQVFGVMLLDIDDLKAVGEQSLQARRAEVGRVRVIITDELDRFRTERSAREVAPLVAALRARMEQLRQVEVARHEAKLAALDPEARAVVEQVTRGLLNKVLHEPTVRLKDAAGSALGEGYADALAALFALRDDGPGAPPEPPTTAGS
ncbi:MAG TPA: glutamyl-tRNA reductase [Acidimicrobiia bacterium]|nr:glutamyl-tRNA reductase [Acidimicrobiia bacterium]